MINADRKHVPPRCKTGAGRLRLNAAMNALFIRELLDGPCTAREIMQTTGTTYRVISNYLTALHRKGCIRIAAWERDVSGKQSIRVFAFGEAPDAAKEPRKQAKRRVRQAIAILTKRKAP